MFCEVTKHLGLSMFSCLSIFLSSFYPYFIQIISWFYQLFILILLKFSLDRFQDQEYLDKVEHMSREKLIENLSVSHKAFTGSANSNWCISDKRFFTNIWHYDKKEDIFEYLRFDIKHSIKVYLYFCDKNLYISEKSSKLSVRFIEAIFKWKWEQMQSGLLSLINFWQNQCL